MTKAKKHVITVDQDFDFTLIGICTHLSDYRLAWSLNENLGLKLSKSQEGYASLNKKKDAEDFFYSMYEFKDVENEIEYFLLKNKSNGKFVVPEKPSMDFFLFIIDNQQLDTDEIVEKMRTIESVLGCYVFDPEEINSVQNIRLG
jgi:hypothetical protein